MTHPRWDVPSADPPSYSRARTFITHEEAIVAIAEVYAEGRRRVTDLVSGLAAEDGGRRVPTCPEWNVSNVVAHLVGVCADIVAGNLTGVATDPWTAAQVRTREGRTLPDLVDEWAEVAPQVEAIADHFGEAGAQLIADLTTHEHDIRTALGRPGARDSAGVSMGLNFLVTGGLQSGIAARGLPSLVIAAGDKSWRVGADEAPGEAALFAAPFELFRSLTGRRSAAQIRQLDWRVTPDPYVPAFEFGPFTISAVDIVE
jgi:uncharacterized protein (TIGR03083 family)